MRIVWPETSAVLSGSEPLNLSRNRFFSRNRLGGIWEWKDLFIRIRDITEKNAGNWVILLRPPQADRATFKGFRSGDNEQACLSDRIEVIQRLCCIPFKKEKYLKINWKMIKLFVNLLNESENYICWL